MATSNLILNKQNETASYNNIFNRCDSIKNILKVAIIILSIESIGSSIGFMVTSFAHIPIYNISSELLLGSAIIGTLSTILFSTATLIIAKYQTELKSLSETKKASRPLFEEVVTPDSLIKTLDAYLAKFKPIDTKIYVGKIDKLDLENDSKIVIKADLHGDFKALENHLKTLQKNVYLDKNLKVVDKYKDKIIIAFLGDYLDRGDKSFKIIDLLMKLKMKNPNEILLLRGNHEDLETSSEYIHPEEKHFYDSKEVCNKLDKFFSTLSLACFIGAKDEKDVYQYTLLTHGAIEPDIDLNELLSKKEKRASILFRNDKKFSLSERITNILPEKLRKDKKLSLYEKITNFLSKKPPRKDNLLSEDLTVMRRALNNFIADDTSKEKLLKVTNLLGIDSIDKKRAKLILSTLRIQIFLNLLFISEKIEKERKEGTSSFNWGDIKNSLGLNEDRSLGLKFTPQFIKDYFRAISSETRKVKTLRAGHAHVHTKFSLHGRKDFIEILPVAGNLEFYDVVRKPEDFAQVVTVKSGKVKTWTKTTLKRPKDAANTKESDTKDFYKTKVK